MSYRTNFTPGEIIKQADINENFILLQNGTAFDVTAVREVIIPEYSIHYIDLNADITGYYESLANKGQPNGYAPLNSSGYIPDSFNPIFSEVIAARGILSSLDNRLSVSLNSDGTLKSALRVDIYDHVRLILKFHLNLMKHLIYYLKTIVFH